MNVQHKAAILIGCALCWTFIGSAVLCYTYTGYVILCAIALKSYGNFLRLKARIRLEIKIEIRLDFDQSKQSSLNLRLVFFLLIG